MITVVQMKDLPESTYMVSASLSFVSTVTLKPFDLPTVLSSFPVNPTFLPVVRDFFLPSCWESVLGFSTSLLVRVCKVSFPLFTVSRWIHSEFLVSSNTTFFY